MNCIVFGARISLCATLPAGRITHWYLPVRPSVCLSLSQSVRLSRHCHNAVITTATQLRCDYDPTTTHRERLLPLTCQSFVLVVSQSNRSHIVISITFVVVECVVASSYRSRIIVDRNCDIGLTQAKRTIKRRRVTFRLVHQSLSGHAPAYIHLLSEGDRRQLRSSATRTWVVPRIHNSYGDKFFCRRTACADQHTTSLMRRSDVTCDFERQKP